MQTDFNPDLCSVCQSAPVAIGVWCSDDCKQISWVSVPCDTCNAKAGEPCQPDCPEAREA